ncbi:MAG: methylmalonyl Co-A mutase-associated GTPase MeaB [Ignavibacteriales bacterium]
MSKKENDRSYKPDWTPQDAGNEFAVRIVKGVKQSQKQSTTKSFSAKEDLSPANYVDGILKGDRVILAKAITLVESNSEKHFHKGQEVLNKILPHSGKSIRIGISGVPGAGKSTFIESLGLHLIQLGYKVAVLSIDPSSSITKGSILGDKTRMEKLSKENNCFIRPSPSAGALGGVTRKTQETILLCEAAGYDVILIETVGVGQSEISVRSMVDFFLLILIAGAGDELQGIKKGIIEIADAIVINKADGENQKNAKIAQTELTTALHFLTPFTKDWKVNVYLTSALFGKGISDIWNVIKEFERQTKSTKVFEQRRKEQLLEWTFRIIENEVFNRFYNSEKVKEELEKVKQQVLNETLLPTTAAESLLSLMKI